MLIEWRKTMEYWPVKNANDQWEIVDGHGEKVIEISPTGRGGDWQATFVTVLRIIPVPVVSAGPKAAVSKLLTKNIKAAADLLRYLKTIQRNLEDAFDEPAEDVDVLTTVQVR